MMLSASHAPPVAVAAPFGVGDVTSVGRYHHPRPANAVPSAFMSHRTSDTSRVSSYRGNSNGANRFAAEEYRTNGHHQNNWNSLQKQHNRQNKRPPTKRRKNRKHRQGHGASKGGSPFLHQRVADHGCDPRARPSPQFSTHGYPNQFQVPPPPPPPPPPRPAIQSSHPISPMTRGPYIPSSPTYCDDSPQADYSQFHHNTCHTMTSAYGLRVPSSPARETSSSYDKNMTELRVAWMKFTEKYRSRSKGGAVGGSKTYHEANILRSKETSPAGRTLYDPSQPQYFL